MLAGKGQSTLFMYNAINEIFPIDKVIIENKISNKKLLQTRIKKVGYLKVINQLLFQIIISNNSKPLRLPRIPRSPIILRSPILKF